MWAGCDGVRKTQAPEDAHVIVGGVFAEEAVIGRLGSNGRAWSPVKDIGGGVKGLDPECGGKIGMDEEDAQDVVGGTD